MSFARTVLGLALLTALAGLARPAAAQVQALALVRSDGPIELVCHGALCSAEFSSFCLQPELASPTPYTRYAMASDADVRLVGERADGSRVVLDARAELGIKILRTHVATRLSVPHLLLLQQKLAKVSVEVGSKVALLPQPEAGERPLGAGEIAAITGGLRDLGDQVVDSDGERMRVVHLVERMINALPPGGRESEAERSQVWAQTIQPDDLEGISGGAKGLVTYARDYCAYASANSMSPSMRACLQSQHDTIMGGLNSDYWDKVKNGT